MLPISVSASRLQTSQIKPSTIAFCRVANAFNRLCDLALNNSSICQCHHVGHRSRGKIGHPYTETVFPLQPVFESIFILSRNSIQIQEHWLCSFPIDILEFFFPVTWGRPVSACTGIEILAPLTRCFLWLWSIGKVITGIRQQFVI